MSSAYPSDPPASRTWWSLGPKHSPQHGHQRQLSRKPSRYSGLNSIAVALGFKSKKHPVLAIQDPGYPPSLPTVPAIVSKSTSRPPSKSVSSTQSQVDSLGPRTPQDPHRNDQQSLFTISDSDPFAVVRAISSAPQSPSALNRLSVFSNSSNPDVIPKGTEPVLNRVSYASSSSQSNTHGSDFPSSPVIPDLTKKTRPKKSTNRKQPLMSGNQALESAWESLTLSNKSRASSSTVFTQDKNRFNQPEAASTGCPPMRARSMTDSGQRPESATLTVPASSSSHRSSGHSRAIIRQPSMSRIGLPPSAPPNQELPPPPSIQYYKVKNDEHEPVAPVSRGSGSSSSLSFASSTSSQKDILFNQHYSPRKKEKVSLERSISTSAGVVNVLDTSQRGFSPPSAPHTLKKAVSHQSLRRRPPPPTSSVPVPLPDLPTPLKAPHKQRSFHHPKLPLPPLSPARSSTSSGSQTSALMTDSQSNTEQRRGSAGGFSLPVRKRLFSAGSNSRRPSTSPSIAPEDDRQSVFSVRSVPDHSTGTAIFKSLGQPLSPNPNSSFWDEVSLPDQTPSSPRAVTHEYTPQQIMSPAEMAKLEASVGDASTSDTSNQQDFSILSLSPTGSMVSDGGPVTCATESFSPTDATSIHAAANKLITRSTSFVQKSLSTPPRLGVRPSTSGVNVTTPTISEQSSPVSSPSPSMTSLPPPPRIRRARPQATFVDDASNPPSLLPPPGRRSVRPKISVEKALHRRSIMRKPSFLEIDDDSDKDTDVESLVKPPSRSFLDLARESFDNTGSISE